MLTHFRFLFVCVLLGLERSQKGRQLIRRDMAVHNLVERALVSPFIIAQITHRVLIIIPTRNWKARKIKKITAFYFIFGGERNFNYRNDRHHRHFAFDLLCKIDRVCGGRCGLSLHARVGGSTEWDGPANTSRGVYYTTTCVVCVWGRSSFHLDGQTKKKKKRFSIF
jgi:hypothetical protein